MTGILTDTDGSYEKGQMEEESEGQYMKRKTIMKLMALTAAAALVVVPASTLNVHAAEKDGIGFNREDWGNNGGEGENVKESGTLDWSWMNDSSDSGSDSGASYEEPAYEEPAAPAEETYVAPAEESRSEPAAVAESGGNGGSGASSGNGGNTSNDSGSTASNTTTTATTSTASTITKSGKVSVPGYETFIQNGSASAGTYKVTHCGDVKAVLQLADANGNAVGCQSILLAPMQDGRYAVAMTTADATATYTVTTTKGDATYLTRLGIVAVTVNGNVVRDLAAEQAAALAAAAAAVQAN